MTVAKSAGLIVLLGTGIGFAIGFNDLDMARIAEGGSKLAKAAVGVSDKDEIQIGREVAANLAARYGLVEDPKKLKYLNLIGQTLVLHCDRPKIPYHFAILRSAEVNALAAPGGYIFVTEGLLQSVNDEAELAGVLAHEISHVTRRHIMKAMRQAKLVEAGEDLAAAAGKDVNKYGKLGDFSINLLGKGLSRGDELDADKLGTLLAADTGYDAAGLLRSIQTIAAKEQSDVYIARFNKTHPPAKDRIDYLEATLSDISADPNAPRLSERFFANLTPEK